MTLVLDTQVTDSESGLRSSTAFHGADSSVAQPVWLQHWR
ncbi:hypothetical protein N601_11185 [Rhodococcus erythropolis DN1]|nr:hypothetical protein N601_11185 [Rhodococcus erythropolis DN1]